MKKNSGRWLFFFFAGGVFVWGYFFYLPATPRDFSFQESTKRFVWVVDDGRREVYSVTGKKTVSAFLQEKKLERDRADCVGISLDKILYGGETIEIFRAKKVFISVGEESKKEVETTRKTAEEAVREQGIFLASDDFILPSPDAVLTDEIALTVVRVVVSEDVLHEDIPFETKEKEDDKLGWRIKKVSVKGEKGVREKKYRVISHNGKVVKKTLVSNEITKSPVTEEVVQGTYVKTGKKSTGQGTWYAYTGTLAAASPWLPLGSYAKVTNRENGKSVIVKINDRGPTGPGRIIDLDKVAFAKIASIGAGVIGVTVEEVLN